MKIFITGATGFVGKAVIRELLTKGHEVTAWVRNPDSARVLFGTQVTLLPMNMDEGGLDRALVESQGVVNLAGENIMKGRWTSQRKAALIHSRVDLTGRLVESMKRISGVSRVLISASAVGYYGDRGDEVLDEQASQGKDFLGELCRQWEESALKAAGPDIRVVIIRLGIILGIEGGVIDRLLTPFRFGVGGRLGDGKQYLSWIHVEDVVRIITAALTDDRYHGVLNATAPAPVTNIQFTKALARVLRRPAILPVPSFALRLALGEAAQALLSSQRTRPRRLEELGFTFSFPELESAIENIVRSL
jgi:hypothetical protein